jgi:uroporphyrinogen decarboxylase
MTSRERVLLTLEHREADRVPLDIGSTANNFTKGLFSQLTEYFDIKTKNLVPRPDESAPFYNDELYEALGGDFRHVLWFPSPVFADKRKQPVLNLIPFACSRRKMQRRYLFSCFVR